MATINKSLRLCDHLCYDILVIIYNYLAKMTKTEGLTTIQWNYLGYLHQFDERPALIRSDGHCEYWQYGRLHRSTGPAITHNPKFVIQDFASMLGLCSHGYEKRVEYWVNGELHNENGPAIIIGDGVEPFEYYSCRGKFEKVLLEGTIKFFYQNGILYRPGGPVVEANNARVYLEDYCCRVEIIGELGESTSLERMSPWRGLVESEA